MRTQDKIGEQKISYSDAKGQAKSHFATLNTLHIGGLALCKYYFVSKLVGPKESNLVKLKSYMKRKYVKLHQQCKEIKIVTTENENSNSRLL